MQARNASTSRLGIADAARAIQLCREGSIDDGIALYIQVINTKDDCGRRPQLPVGIHLRLLEDAGLTDAAAAIRHSAVMAGHNVCIGTAFKKPPDEIVAEYRELFADGIVNSAMVADYLVELSKLNEIAELTEFIDPDRLFRRTEISIDDDDAPKEQFWNTVASTLLEQQSEDNWQEAVQSVHGMNYIRLADHRAPCIQRVLKEIHNHVSRYVADIGTGGTALPWVPQAFRLSAWALISSGFGYNSPHIHPKGWITGVLYVAGPDEIDPDGNPVGALRIGPPRGIENTVGWPNFAVAPKPGTLVLMPSYFTHWTTPLGRPGLRISIAFDVIDLRIEQTES